jgi:hypothetical protein
VIDVDADATGHAPGSDPREDPADRERQNEEKVLKEMLGRLANEIRDSDAEQGVKGAQAREEEQTEEGLAEPTLSRKEGNSITAPVGDAPVVCDCRNPPKDLRLDDYCRGM